MPEDETDGEKGGPIVQGQAVTETGLAEEQMSEGATDWTKIREQVEDKLGPALEISLVAMNGLVTALQSGNRQMARNEKAADRTENTLTEVTCMLGKVVDALNRLKNAVEENTREDRRREWRWFEIERKREEERKKEREAERRRKDRRRDAEKKELEEIKRLLTSKKEDEKKGTDEKEENNKKKEIKSALGKSYTETTISDLSKKK